jgi:choline dehydrogenase-like flavoprotein
MHIDAHELPADASLASEIVVVGAGPAGIVIALELARLGHRTLLIESGGTSRPGDQSLGDLSGSDSYHVDMSLATRRKLGGASNLWGGRCVPFDPVDFDTRPITGGVRWPVTYEDIAAYYQRACDWFLCGEAVFSALDIPALRSRTLIPGLTDGNVQATALERWSLPTNFGRQYRARLRRSDLVTLVTNLTCTEIVCQADGPRVDHLVAKTPTGNAVTITGSKYVIACGGVESTRLLFASNTTFPAGIGNHSNHLGRWYMAHIDSRIGRVHFNTPPDETIYGHERDPSGVYVRRRFTFARDFLLTNELPNSAMWPVNPDITDARHGSGTLSFVYLMLASPLGQRFISEGIRQAHIKSATPPSTKEHLLNVARDFPRASSFALRFGFDRYIKPGRKVPGFFVRSASNDYQLQYHGEHLPNWNSYLKPTTQRDALGMIRLEPHLSFAETDVLNVVRAHQYLDRYLRERRLGFVDLPSDDTSRIIDEQLNGGYHQAGTTRMSSDRKDGVVDSNLAVHNFTDLFVASSSTFVTSGQANSTFMIVAFGLRLVDHLHKLMR